jgi:serine/threonine protein kinase
MTPVVTKCPYCAPELLFLDAEKHSSYGAHVDMWSLGVLFAELMCDKSVRLPLFHDYDSGSELATLALIRHWTGSCPVEFFDPAPDVSDVPDVQNVQTDAGAALDAHLSLVSLLVKCDRIAGTDADARRLLASLLTLVSSDARRPKRHARTSTSSAAVDCSTLLFRFQPTRVRGLRACSESTGPYEGGGGCWFWW